MKVLSHILLFFIITIPGAVSFAQNQNGAPQGFNYQAIARDYNGQEMRNVDIAVRVSIYPGMSGPFEWRELHSVTTNRFGLFTIIVGQGTRVEGSVDHFKDIAWGSSAHYLEVELDFPDDAFGFLPTGKNQLFSVPYAIYANFAANGGSGGILDNDTDPTNERQNFSQTDTLLLLINNDGSIQSSVRCDFDPKNELQDLLIDKNILKITNNPDANDINLAPYLDNTDNQTLINKGDSIGISGGNTINLSRFKDNTDQQQLILETDSIRITNGNAVNISELRNPQSVYFYAIRTTAYTASGGEYYMLKFDDVKTNAGTPYNSENGNFTAILNGLYSFYFVYEANESQSIYLFINNSLAETFVSNTETMTYRLSFMKYLNTGDIVNLVVYNRLAAPSPIGTGTFSGFKVY
ncbi:MAG: hypothetical protein JW723_07975 [Bacteroidales bacterium]|nr:hypothetical protein [Bacteroidales bacterium]